MKFKLQMIDSDSGMKWWQTFEGVTKSEAIMKAQSIRGWNVLQIE